MNKFNVKQMAKSVKVMVSNHSPAILTGLGIAGMVSTVILSVKATPKALHIIEEEKRKRYTDRLSDIPEQYAPTHVSAKDKIRMCWKCYAPATITGIFSIGCIIGANSVHMKRSAALATAYKISETAFSEFKEKTLEAVGEQKMNDIKKEVHKDAIKKNPPKNNAVIMATSGGDTLCYDCISGRYFTSSIDKIERAVNAVNKRMYSGSEFYISLNDFYDEINSPSLTHIGVGYEIGWSIYKGGLELDYSAQIVDSDEANGLYTNQPCIVIDYSIAPQRDYDKM